MLLSRMPTPRGCASPEDFQKLVNRGVEQVLPAYLLRKKDLEVFPKHVAGEWYVAEDVELLLATANEALNCPGEAGRDQGIVEKASTAVHWNRVG
jgi:hypothetical protein